MSQGAGDRGKGTVGQRGRALRTEDQRTQRRAESLAFHMGGEVLAFVVGVWERTREVKPKWLT